MYLKRLLTGLLGLGFILSLSTSCDNDRKDFEIEPTLEIKDLANTYTADKLIINAKEAKETSSVVVSIDKENTAEFKLINVVGNASEVVFTTEITKEETGAYSFQYTDDIINSEDGWTINFSGSFVGSSKSGTIMVVNYKEVKHLKLEDISGEYLTETLMLNNKTADDEITATLELDKEGKGNIILHNITIGEPELMIPVIFTKGENINEFFLEDTSLILKGAAKAGAEAKDERKIVISGSVVDDVLTLNHSVKILSEVVGDWELKVDIDLKGARRPEFVMDAAVPGNIMLGIIIRSAAATLKPELGNAIESVSLQFGDNGKLKIGYTLPSTPTENQDPKKSRIVSDEKESLPLDLDYYVKDGVVYLAIHKDLIDMLGIILPPSFPVSLAQIKDILILQGTYYALPLHQDVKTDFASKRKYTVFHLNKDITTKILPLLEPLLPEDGIPEGIPLLGGKSKQEVIDEYLTPLSKATKFNIGLGFWKIGSKEVE